MATAVVEGDAPGEAGEDWSAVWGDVVSRRVLGKHLSFCTISVRAVGGRQGQVPA